MALRDVSDTALMVAVHRARESQRARPVFRDPLAMRLAGDRGREIVRAMRYGGVSWPVVARTVVIDEVVQRLAPNVECVLDLAAGLDTRPYRLDLPADLRWVEADLPAVLDYKAGLLAGEVPRCRLERRPVDLADADGRRGLLDELAGIRTLVLSEGVLVYLAREDVEALARDLAARPGYERWLCDVAGSLFLEWTARGSVGRQLAGANATMRFAPDEGPDFFRPLGWEPVEVRSSWDEARRLGRLPLTMRALWAISPASQRRRFLDLTRVVLLRRAPA